MKLKKELTKFDIKVLRELNGETQDDLVAGAALWQAAAYLRKIGFAVGHYNISEAGKKFLQELDNEQ